MRIIVASDFHLKYKENEEDLQRRERVNRFLKSLIGKTDVLILAGDIFDLWYDWSTVIIKDYFLTLKLLAEIKESGTRIIFVSGNHDFWFGDFLTKTIGLEIYDKHFSDYIGNKKFFITHGDLYTINDLRYQIYRRFIRSFFPRLVFKCLHPHLSLNIGKLFSRSSRSREASPMMKEKKEKGLLHSAEIILETHDFVIMGHSHKPKLIAMNNGWYINSGDWIKNNSFCLIENDKPELIYVKG